jgi:protein ImuB
MLWLALHLPRLSLETFCATLGAADTAESARGVALIDGHQVVAVDAAAAAAGVQPGMKRATALALAPELLLAASDPARDTAALHAVAHAALAFTPTVTLHDAATVLLEVQACLRLFRGLGPLRQRLLAALAPLGHRLHLAAAPTPLGAALLAQWQPAQGGDLVLGEHATKLPALQRLLAGLPLGHVAPGREPDLQGLGLQRLGELLRLPRAGLARRFGEDLLERIDRALGRRADPRRPLEPPATFDARLELYTRAEHTEQLLAAADVLLARLLAWAQARCSRVAAFTLRMTHERVRGAGDRAPPATELRLALAEPSLDAAHLRTLLRERLARCTLAAPTLELQLHCHELVRAPPPNGELFPARASQAEGLARLLERLRARLGDEQVRRLVAVADHRPECATRSVPVQGGPLSGSMPASVPSMLLTAGEAVLPLHRPAWLLPEPLPLAERDRQPLLDGRPLALLSGPERIETGWWDGEPALRDYFIAAAADGALVWVFRSRLPVAPADSAGEATWFLQGRFG